MLRLAATTKRDRKRERPLLTSQFPVEHWHDLIGDPTIADAILDHLVHNAYKLDLKRDSMRKRQVVGFIKETLGAALRFLAGPPTHWRYVEVDVAEANTRCNETVVLVHGTFQGPKPGVFAWYQPGSEFCKKLDYFLSAHGSSARCWNHEADIFSWSGENTITARLKAARELRTYLEKLVANGWRCHVVAHSHGGMLLLEAVHQLQRSAAAKLGYLCTLGTPFLKLSKSPVFPFKAPLFALALLLALWLTTVCWLNLLQTLGWYWWALLLITLTFTFVRRLLRYELSRMPDFSAPFLQCPTGEEPLLAINSPEDEAFRFLEHLLTVENPIPATRTEMSGALIAGLRRAVLFDKVHFPGRSWSIAATLTLLLAATAGVPLHEGNGHKSLLLAAVVTVGLVAVWQPTQVLRLLFLPLRVLFFGYALLGSIVRAAVFSRMRKFAWRIIQGAGFGFSGSPFSIDDIALDRVPRDLGVHYVYEDLDPQVVSRALTHRKEHIDPLGPWLADFLSDFRPGEDILSPLTEIFSRVDLIHSAYYQDPKIIERIAVWIAMPIDERCLRAAMVKDREHPLSEYKRTVEQGLPAYKAILAYSEQLSPEKQKQLIQRGIFINGYQGCCHSCLPADDSRHIEQEPVEYEGI